MKIVIPFLSLLISNFTVTVRPEEGNWIHEVSYD